MAAELARLVHEVAVPVPTLEALHRFMCFPKLVLQSSERRGRKHQRQVAHDLERRLRLFQSGQLEALWTEAKALVQRKPKEPPARTRARAKMEEDGTMPESQVEMIRVLVNEGALSKATKLLLSQGLANSQDPMVEKTLRGLHPQALPHLVAGDSLPASATGSMADNMGAEEDGESMWARRAWAAISSFPPGSAGGPSGLRPIHLTECCRKLGAGSPLVQALGSLSETALTNTFPDSVREVLCASTLIPL